MKGRVRVYGLSLCFVIVFFDIPRNCIGVKKNCNKGPFHRYVTKQ